LNTGVVRTQAAIPQRLGNCIPVWETSQDALDDLWEALRINAAGWRKIKATYRSFPIVTSFKDQEKLFVLAVFLQSRIQNDSLER
jgi:hypothetical protein